MPHAKLKAAKLLGNTSTSLKNDVSRVFLLTPDRMVLLSPNLNALYYGIWVESEAKLNQKQYKNAESLIKAKKFLKYGIEFQ